jgi:muramoyltetrapeptide carboxypeptidase LdcA involved in peptidoglycan recycling
LQVELLLLQNNKNKKKKKASCGYASFKCAANADVPVHATISIGHWTRSAFVFIG